MCLLCNGEIRHGERYFRRNEKVRFRDGGEVLSGFRELYPGTLDIMTAIDNSGKDFEKMGRQTLTLIDAVGASVTIRGIASFSSDLFWLAGE